MIKLGNKEVKNFGVPYIIAEIGSNHNGDMELAFEMIDKAIESGADAVKFQSWTNSSLVSREEYNGNLNYNDKKKHFGSLEEMFTKYYLREDQHYILKDYCDKKGVVFCSTPFTEAETDLLDNLGVPFFKVASCDLNNIRLLKYIAKKMKPIILSTGMGTISEIDQAVKTIEQEGNFDIIILHCIAIYPPKSEDIHLNNITMLQKMYPSYPIGFSDHTLGTVIPLASVALGSCLIEKHFTTDKNMDGWDHDISATPEELRIISDQSKIVSNALGNFYRTVSIAEEEKKIRFRRSAVVTRNMRAGEIIKEEDICYKRPGSYIPASEEMYLLGRTLKVDLKEDDILKWEHMV